MRLQRRRELATLAAEIERRGDYPAIREWLEAYNAVDHPEASRIVWTINLFEALGVDF